MVNNKNGNRGINKSITEQNNINIVQLIREN